MVYANKPDNNKKREVAALPPQEVHDQALSYLSKECFKCHGNSNSQGKFSSVLEVKTMIEQGYILPGNPLQSPLYKSMKNNLGLKMPMPPGGANEQDLELIYNWIAKLVVE